MIPSKRSLQTEEWNHQFEMHPLSYQRSLKTSEAIRIMEQNWLQKLLSPITANCVHLKNGGFIRGARTESCRCEHSLLSSSVQASGDFNRIGAPSAEPRNVTENLQKYSTLYSLSYEHPATYLRSSKAGARTGLIPGFIFGL